MEGTVREAYPNRGKGLIRGDDGYETASESRLCTEWVFMPLFPGCVSASRYGTAG